MYNKVNDLAQENIRIVVYAYYIVWSSQKT